MSGRRVLMMSGFVRDLVRMSGDDYAIDILTDHPDRDAWLAANGAGIRVLVCTGVERLDAGGWRCCPIWR